MPTLIVYPNAHPEASSVDGTVQCTTASDAGLTWADMIVNPGSGFSDNVDGTSVTIKGSNTLNRWMILRRAILLFDTSALLVTDRITSATLEIYGYGQEDHLGILPNCNIYSSDPTSDIGLENGDFASLGSVAFCDNPIAYGDWNPSGMNIFLLNPAGLLAIVKDGITKLGVRNANYDVAGAEPSNWANQQYSTLYFYTADKGSIRRPKLTIVYERVLAPTVTTDPASSIGPAKATLNGTLDDDGYETCDCGFEYGLTTSYGTTTSTQSKSTGETFSQNITGLLPNRLYHFRALATNSADTDQGSDRTFKTTFLGNPIVDQVAHQHCERMTK